MAYGTPYLLDLGLTKSYMSLVWIAGPLSGKLKKKKRKYIMPVYVIQSY